MKKQYCTIFLVVILGFHALQASQKLRIRSQSLHIDSEIDLIEKWGCPFLPLHDFAKTMGFARYEDREKQKIVIKTNTVHFIFTGNNSFVIVNKAKVIQLRLECLWHDDQVWIAISELQKLFNAYSALKTSYHNIERVFTIEPIDVTIPGIEIAAKKNGTMIRIHTTRRFPEEAIDMGKRYGWYHVEIAGGVFDSLQIINTPVTGIINAIQARMIGETASFEFKLHGNLISSDHVIDEYSNDIVINLRTDAKAQVNKNVLKELEKQKQHSIIDIIVLDAGHGGEDPGTTGYNGRIIEKHIVLSIALKLGALIEKKMPNVKVIYTRKSDINIPLARRTQIANENDGKLFISIHANAIRKKSIRGFETYFMGVEKDEAAREVVLKENSVVEKFEGKRAVEEFEDMSVILATMMQSANIKQSQYLASLVQNAMQINLKKLGMKSNGVRQGPFLVMWRATMPNILVEVGYTSHKEEAKLLMKESTQQKIAEAIFLGIKKYKEDVESAI